MLGQKIAVIGAGGKMGSWFTNYFIRQEMQVSVFDLQKILQFSQNVKVASSINDCVRDADLVIICVPVSATPQLVNECAKNMKPGAVIAEIASVKQKAFFALKRVRSDLRPLCIHPMFGPGASEKKQIKLILIPVRNEEAERKVVNTIFKNVMIKILPDAKTHDKAIAIVLGLTYFTNIAFAKVMQKNDLQLLKQISGTTFGLQSLLAESVLTDEPALIVALIKDNPFARKYIKQYIKSAEVIEKMVSVKSSKGLEVDLKKIKSKIQKQQDLQQSYRRLYEIIESLK